MSEDRVSTDQKVEQLRESLSEYYENKEFLKCKTMGKLMKESLDTLIRSMESHWGVDTDLSPLLVIEAIQNADQYQFSQEFNLIGRNGSFDWLVGLYYFEEEAEKSGGTLLVPELATVEFDPVFGIPNPLPGSDRSIALAEHGVSPALIAKVMGHGNQIIKYFRHLLS